MVKASIPLLFQVLMFLNCCRMSRSFMYSQYSRVSGAALLFDVLRESGLQILTKKASGLQIPQRGRAGAFIDI